MQSESARLVSCSPVEPGASEEGAAAPAVAEAEGGPCPLRPLEGNQQRADAKLETEEEDSGLWIRASAAVRRGSVAASLPPCGLTLLSVLQKWFGFSEIKKTVGEKGLKIKNILCMHNRRKHVRRLHVSPPSLSLSLSLSLCLSPMS